VEVLRSIIQRMEPSPPFNYALPLYAIWCILPPILHLLQHFKKVPFPNWASCVLFCLIGWGAIFWATMLRFDYLHELAFFVPREEQAAILEQWAADGGPKLMALFGGGLLSLIYFCAWWIGFRLFSHFRNLARLTSNPQS